MQTVKFKWTIPIIVIAILSQDYWNWNPNSIISFWGFPSVVVYFFILQILLAGAIWLFVKKSWRE